MALVYFLALLGGLIFFHELGHFLLARAMGVHVVTFSIGFGPTLFKIRGRDKGPWGPTEYVVAALPLGGYVRMLGDDPSEELPASHEAVSFHGKPIWRRLLIVSAGPAFNLLLPYLIYFASGLATTSHTPSWIGMVDDAGPAAGAGLRPGDRVTSIDGDEVDYWWQVQKTVSERPGERLALTVERPGSSGPLSLEVVPSTVRERLLPGLEVFEELGRIGVTPVYLRPMVAVVPGSAAWQAGLRSGDLLTAVDGRPVRSLDDALARLDAGDRVSLSWKRFSLDPGATGPAGFVRSSEHEAELPAGRDRGVASYDCVVDEVRKGSPAESIGLAPGDVLLSLDGRACRYWGFLGQVLDQAPREPHTLVWSHRGRIVEETRDTWIASVVAPSPNDPSRTIQTFGLHTREGLFEAPDPVPNEHVLAFAATDSVDRTNDAIHRNVAAIAGLFAGDVSTKELSGPIGIAQLASQTSERGWGYFFGLMVWLSISLGLINLLPIPVLDGGHVLFLAIEAVRRRPVSLRTRQIANYIGLAFIILLMVLVFKNDLERPWG